MIKTIVYVNLLNEGTSVLRPVPAQYLGGNRYLLLKTNDYDPDDEEWEYLPGATVACEEETNEGEIILVAKSMAK
jgi:hypothetical protein